MMAVSACSLVLLSFLASVVIGNPIMYMSFTHGVLNGPNADVYVNDVLVWPNVTPGSVTPYVAAEAFNITMDNQIQSYIEMTAKIVGTSKYFWQSSISGMIFTATNGNSAFMTLYGVFNSTTNPVWMDGYYNYDASVGGSQNSALRFYYCGPSVGVSVRVSLFKYSTMTSSYLKYSDQLVDSLGKSMYAVMGNGVYLVKVLNEVDGSVFFTGNITLEAGSSYSLVIMGNMTSSAQSGPISVALRNDVIPNTPIPIPTTSPHPRDHHRHSGVSKSTFNIFVVLAVVGSCAVGVVAYLVGRRHSKKATKEYVEAKIPLYAPVVLREA